MNINKDLYGQKQDSKRFYDLMKDNLTREMKFQKFLPDSCFFKNKDDLLWTCIYVDYILFVGNDTIVEENIKSFQEGLISQKRI